MYLADYNKEKPPARVAVKFARVLISPADTEEFFNEAEIMITLDHPSILKVRLIEDCYDTVLTHY